MSPHPPISPRTAPLFPSTTLFRSRTRGWGRVVHSARSSVRCRNRRCPEYRGNWVGRCVATRCWWGRSEEHTSELQSLMRISYAVFCLKKKKKTLYRTDELTKQINDRNIKYI